MAAAFLVNPLKIAVPEQSHTVSKSGAFAGSGQINTCICKCGDFIHDSNSGCGIAINSGKGNRLLTEAGLNRHPLAPLGAPTRDHRLAALGLHPGTKSVRLRAVTSVRLECPLGHETSLLLILLVGAIIAIRRMRSINDAGQTGKLGSDQIGPAHQFTRRDSWYAHFLEHSNFAILCTMLAAVIDSLLDRLFFRVLNSPTGRKIFREVLRQPIFLC
jgi:hypothetical protein